MEKESYTKTIRLIQKLPQEQIRENAEKLRNRIIELHNSHVVAQGILDMVQDKDWIPNPFYEDT